MSTGLANEGFDVYVYSSHNHDYKEAKLDNVHIIHQYDPEYLIGTIGQFIYDFNCILDVRKKKYDIVYQLGYATSSIWSWLLPKNVVVISNMDGMEWNRAQYGIFTRKFVKIAERLAIKSSTHFIADSLEIRDYLLKYLKPVTYIPYGANIFTSPNDTILKLYGIKPYQFNLLIARLVPENNIEMILNGVQHSKEKKPFFVIGNFSKKYGKSLQKKFSSSEIRFLGSIFDDEILNNLRHYSNLYFHGHSVGGTNPSLLEAMSSQTVICAHDNPFNREVLESNALYFSSSKQISAILDSFIRDPKDPSIEKNQLTILKRFHWPDIIYKYSNLFKSLVPNKFSKKEIVTNSIS